MMPITGDAKFVARLRKAALAGPAMTKWANESAELIAVEARTLVDEGGIPSPNHIVSTSPNPPNTDTGNLVRHTNAKVLPEPGQAAVISDALSDGGYSYSLGLEFGNRRVAERPFLRPATTNKRKAILQSAVNAVNTITKS